MAAIDPSGSGTSGNRRKLVLAAVVLIAAAGIAVFVTQGDVSLPGGDQDGFDTGEGEQDEFDQYAQPEEESGTTDVGEDVEVGATVEIQDAGVSPGRAEIKVGEAVRWENTNDFPVQLYFSSTSQTPTIEPGGTLEMRFRADADYDLNNTDTGESLAGGFVYVE